MEPVSQAQGAPPRTVFISYSHEDRKFVRQLEEDLESQNLQVILDEQFHTGDHLSVEIPRAIGRADYFLVVLSKSSVASRWVLEELRQAHPREVEKGKPKILQVLLEDCERPDMLAGRIWTDFRDPDRYREELQKLVRSMGQEPVAVPEAAKARPWRRLTALALAVGLAALAASLIWKLWLSRPRAPVSIAVRDFECDGFGYGFAAGLSEMLAAALSLEQNVRVIDRRLVLEAERDLELSHLKNDDEPEHFRRNVDADFLVSGSCGAGGSPAVSLRLVLTPTSGRPAFVSKPHLGDSRNPAFLAAQLAGEIRSRLRAGGSSVEKDTESLQRLFPRDPEALAGYFEGLARLQRFESEKARKVLEAAARKEAHPKILRLQAVALWDLGDNAAVDKARAAEVVARNLHFPRREHLEIIKTRAMIEEKWEDEMMAYQELRDNFPWELLYGLSLADAQRATGKVAASLDTLADLRRQWTSPAALARIDVRHAELLHHEGRYREAALLAERAAAEARNASARSMEARVDLVLAQIDSARGRHSAARDKLIRTLYVFQESRDRDRELICRELLAIESFALGETPQLDELRKEYRAMGNQEGLARLLHFEGAMALERGDYVAADSLSKQALEILRSLGEADRVSEAVVLAERAFLFFAWGRPVESARLAGQAFSIYNDQRDADGMAGALQVLSEIEYHQGRLAFAEEHQRSALAEHDRAGSWERVAFGKYRLGMVYAQNGNPAARACLQAGVNEQQHPLYLAEARLGLSFFETLEGDPEEGLKLANQAAKDLPSAQGTWRGEQVRLARIQALLAQGATGFAMAELPAVRSAAREQKDFRVRLDAEILVARLEAASGRSADRTRALVSLAKIAEDARRAGYLLYAMEARLARGEILLRAGGVSAALGREELESVAREAAGAGLARFVARAETALGVALGASRLRAAESRVQATPPFPCAT